MPTFFISSKVARNRCWRIEASFEQPGLERLVGVDLQDPVRQGPGLEGPRDGELDELLLGLHDPEDRALGDAGRLGDLPGGHRPAVLARAG